MRYSVTIISILMMIVPACGQDFFVDNTGVRPVSRDKDVGETKHGITVTDSGVDTKILSEFIFTASIGGGTVFTVDEQDENKNASYFSYVNASAIWHVGDISVSKKRAIYTEFGMHVKGEYSVYQSENPENIAFDGQLMGFAGGLELNMYDAPDASDLHIWGVSNRFLVGYRVNEGELDDDSYEMDEETLFFEWELRLEFYWPLRSVAFPKSNAAVCQSQPVDVLSGFSPKMELWLDLKIPLDDKRDSTVLDDGGKDKHEKEELQFALRWQFYRWYRPAGEHFFEISPGVMVRGKLFRAAGYQSMDANDWVFAAGPGVFVDVAFDRQWYLLVETAFMIESETDRSEFMIGATLSMRF